MRTTVEIADSLMRELRRIMSQRQTTLRALVEDGLRRIISEDSQRAGTELPRAAFPGPTGFAEGVDPADLGRVIGDAIHRGRDAT